MSKISLPQKLSNKRVILAACAVLMLFGISSGFSEHAQAYAPRLHPNNFSTSYLDQVTTAANTAGDATTINNPATNGNPNAILLVSQDLNIAHSCCVYNNHRIATWYSTFTGRWEIFNEDGATMPLNVGFWVDVWSGPVQESGRTIYTHVAGAQTSADSTDINNSISNHNPNALVFVTPNWSPPGTGQSSLDNHVVGVWYNIATSRWAIYNEDGAPMPSAAAFNVVVYAPNTDPTEVYSITSGSTNTLANYTDLSSPWSTQGLLTSIHVYTLCVNNGCPSYWNHQLGSWYNSGTGHVSIFNEDGVSMYYGLKFNVMNVHFG